MSADARPPHEDAPKSAGELGWYAPAMTMIDDLDGPHARLLKPSEVAKLLRVEASTLASWRRRGIGPRFFRLNARAVRYAEDEVTRFLSVRREAELR